MIAPLRRTRLDGRLYTRDPKVEAQLGELSVLSRDELLARCLIRNRKDRGYVPSECLLYFVRASRHDNSERHFERLYRVLAERVLRALPEGHNADGETASLTRQTIRESVFGRFAELLAMDRRDYFEKLDYFEVRFDGALASLRRDAQERAWRDENRSEQLPYDEQTGELSPEIEQAAGTFDPFEPPGFDDPAYRSRLDAAIEALPPEQSRIIEMLRQGIPIDSKDRNATTIAKALGRSEKTVRTYRDKAIAELRKALKQGEVS